MIDRRFDDELGTFVYCCTIKVYARICFAGIVIKAVTAYDEIVFIHIKGNFGIYREVNNSTAATEHCLPVGLAGLRNGRCGR